MPRRPKNFHKTVIISLNEHSIEVDEEISPLILELNKMGLKTTQSCQGGTKGCEHAYITFHLDDNSYFDYLPETRQLSLRWNRTDRKFLPISSFIHLRGQIKRIEEM